MTVRKAIELFKQHQKATFKKSTLKSYRKFLDQLEAAFSDREVDSLPPDEISRSLRHPPRG
jgi:CRISPR/Cas system-associated protein Cas10 (large subunit of type III CRISPR-Cas system)